MKSQAKNQLIWAQVHIWNRAKIRHLLTCFSLTFGPVRFVAKHRPRTSNKFTFPAKRIQKIDLAVAQEVEHVVAGARAVEVHVLVEAVYLVRDRRESSVTLTGAAANCASALEGFLE